MLRGWSVLSVIACVVLITPSLARAEDKLIAVLPLDVSNTNGRMDKAARTSVEEMLRDVATDALASDGWTVMTGENTLQVLIDNGVDASKCGEASCHLEMARELKASKFLSGAVQWVEGEFVASIRLIDSRTGRVIATARLEGPTTRSLRKEFESKSAAFFAKSGLLAKAAPAPAPVAVLPTPVPVPTPPPPLRAERSSSPPPDRDMDGDGIPDSRDLCPAVPEVFNGYRDDDGCPDGDKDGDGVIDALDDCVEITGLASNHGCPVLTHVQMTADHIVLKEKIQFDVAKATIRSVSYPLLDEVAAGILSTKNVTYEVGGHMDATGSSVFNLKLSRERAEAVRGYLLKKGVSSAQLTSKGYGDLLPIAPNNTAAGRAENRRIEITVVK